MTTSQNRHEPRKTARQARAKRTVERILAAAARILKRDGPSKITTNHIAEEANISVGSIYQYFPNKQAILVQLMSQQLDEAMAIRPEALDSEVSLQEHIEAAVRWHLDVRRDDPLLFQRLFELQQEVLTHKERSAFETFHRDSVLRGLTRHADEIAIPNLNTASIIVSHFILATTQSATASDPTLVSDEDYESQVVSALLAYLTG
ncbi:MAG: TetR/AcrR family transcriptional regulator [Pseudomonadota bacterium]